MRGYEVDEISKKQQKSLSHQVTINHNRPDSIKKITTLFIKISEEIEKRLIKKELFGRSIEITLYFSDYSKWTNKIENLSSFNQSDNIIVYIKMLLKKLKIYCDIKKIIVSIYHLTDLRQPQLLITNHPTLAQPLLKTADSRESGSKADYARAQSFFDTSISLNKVGFSGDLVRDIHQ